MRAAFVEAAGRTDSEGQRRQIALSTGSSLVVNLLAMGILLNISQQASSTAVVALPGARGPREESESASAGARARGGGAPRALINV